MLYFITILVAPSSRSRARCTPPTELYGLDFRTAMGRLYGETPLLAAWSPYGHSAAKLGRYITNVPSNYIHCVRSL